MDNYQKKSPVSLVTVSTLTLHWVKNEAPRASDCVWVPVDTEVELVADLDKKLYLLSKLEKRKKAVPFHLDVQNSHAGEDNPEADCLRLY